MFSRQGAMELERQRTELGPWLHNLRQKRVQRAAVPFAEDCRQREDGLTDQARDLDPAFEAHFNRRG